MRRLLGVEGAPWECAWTGRTLDGRFEVDHASPYSVWGNNDRWNLLPCLARVNRAKSDALPTRQLLVRRRVALVRYCTRSTMALVRAAPSPILPWPTIAMGSPRRPATQ